MSRKDEGRKYIAEFINPYLPDRISRTTLSEVLRVINNKNIADIQARLLIYSQSEPELRPYIFMYRIFNVTPLRRILSCAVPDKPARTEVLRKITGSPDIRI